LCHFTTGVSQSLQDGWLKLSDFFGKHSRDCVYYYSTFDKAVGVGGGGECGTREESGTLKQGGAPFSLVPLVWESNPKLQGVLCKPQPPVHRGI